jgi:hypothetical protein
MVKLCSFCDVKSGADVSLFEMNDEIKGTLGLPQELWQNFSYICANHFNPSDVSGGARSRLRPGAHPVHFPLPIQSYVTPYYAKTKVNRS